MPIKHQKNTQLGGTHLPNPWSAGARLPPVITVQCGPGQAGGATACPRSWVASAPIQGAINSPSCITNDPMRSCRSTFGSSEEIMITAMPSLAARPDQPINLGLGANVRMPAGRFVEDQDSSAWSSANGPAGPFADYRAGQGVRCIGSREGVLNPSFWHISSHRGAQGPFC
ncbi:hypothetical protein FQR65_LT20358 [Abscondita terminalis]|nr:hypothetical protein FQR65_LT20358 [Abscondita terminalis]